VTGLARAEREKLLLGVKSRGVDRLLRAEAKFPLSELREQLLDEAW